MTQKKIGMKVYICFFFFAVRESVQESLGFSPFELVFGHTVLGPLKLLKEKVLSDDDSSLNLLQYVSDFKNRLSKAYEAALSNLKSAQNKMKLPYDENFQDRNLNLETRYLLFCPFLVSHCKLGIMVLTLTLGRRKQKQLCHINMLKKYIERASSDILSVSLLNTVPPEQNQMDSEDMNFVKSDPASSKIKNSDILKDLDHKLSHHSPEKRLI